MARDFELRRKRGGHLWSKLRYMSAQLCACLENELWLRHGRQANAMAQRLAEGLAQRRIELVQPVEANEVFALMSAALIASLRAQGFEFYEWPARRADQRPVVRLVTAYDMTSADIDALLAAV